MVQRGGQWAAAGAGGASQWRWRTIPRSGPAPAALRYPPAAAGAGTGRPGDPATAAPGARARGPLPAGREGSSAARCGHRDAGSGPAAPHGTRAQPAANLFVDEGPEPLPHSRRTAHCQPQPSTGHHVLTDEDDEAQRRKVNSHVHGTGTPGCRDQVGVRPTS